MKKRGTVTAADIERAAKATWSKSRNEWDFTFKRNWNSLTVEYKSKVIKSVTAGLKAIGLTVAKTKPAAKRKVKK